MSNTPWQPVPPEERPRSQYLVWGLVASVFCAVLGAAYIYLSRLPAATPAEPTIIDLTTPSAAAVVRPTDIPVAPLINSEVNILLLGIDQRPGQSVATRSDTMLLVSINQNTGQMGMISIPRDLYVAIPGHGNDKINTAHFYGENAQDGGGPPLAKQTVQNFVGVPVQYYARFNFQAFRTLVDAIGGIDVDVPKAIDDPDYPDDNCPDPDHCGFAPLHINAGRQHMDGTLALKYARTRHADSDFYRARRQQQVILAIRDKVLRANMIPVLLLKAPALLGQLSNSLSTDLTLSQLAGLAQMLLTNKLDSENIHQFVIDETLVSDSVTAEGAQVLLSNKPAIQAALRTYFGQLAMAATPAPPTASPNLQQVVAAEGARIQVLNGTSIAGLGHSTSDWLQQAGFIVVNVSDADRADYANSQIIDEGNKPRTREALRATLKLPNASVTAVNKQKRANGAPDITLILGKDFKLPK